MTLLLGVFPGAALGTALRARLRVAWLRWRQVVVLELMASMIGRATPSDLPPRTVVHTSHRAVGLSPMPYS